ncbi:hypothetical protein IP88_12130 [alpha proteobacterium AAP81b]|nr:hypothetical protein IP88_12130 [alpha proteobacterium AAP81b]
MRILLLAMAGLAGLAACSNAPQTASAPPPPPRVAATPIAGAEPVKCVQLQNIRESRVIDDSTIDFYLRDGRVLRNNLPGRCPQLGFERAFTYQTSITQLCNVDIITVLYQGGGIRQGASCGLGSFTPIEPPARRG